MTKATWIVPTVLSAAFILGYVGFSAWQQIERSRAKAYEARIQAENRAAESEQLRNQLVAMTERVQDLQDEKEQVSQAQRALEQQMRAALESRDITISELQGKLTVNILDRILFDSGEAVLKPDGEQVLQKIATILAQYPNRQVHVIGHTDNVPIKASARSRFASNWELSTARATAAVRFLSEHAGVDPRRLGAVGYGEFRPVADNSNIEGRAKNRRIALVVLSEEMVGSDVAPTARPTGESNHPPVSQNPPPNPSVPEP